MSANLEETSEDFSSYLGQVTNMAFIAHAIGIGSSLGIFDVMVTFDKPRTCEEIAQAGQWKTRYIKEWLALMVCGKIIDYNKEDKTYFIPEQRRHTLSLGGKSLNSTVFLQGLHVVTQVVPELKTCFPLDGPRGIPYSSYKGFHEWRNKRVAVKYSWENIREIIGNYPKLWNNLEKGIHVLDGGCSTGVQAVHLAENFPNTSFMGFDIDEDAIKNAELHANQKNITNLTFQVQDACNMPKEWENSFDLFMVWDVVHDVPYSKKFLREIIRVLKPGGMFFMNDINVHTEVNDNIDKVQHAPNVYGMSMFHCMPVSLYFEGGEGLGAAWGKEKQKQYLEEAGFRDIDLLPVNDSRHTFYVSYKAK